MAGGAPGSAAPSRESWPRLRRPASVGRREGSGTRDPDAAVPQTHRISSGPGYAGRACGRRTHWVGGDRRWLARGARYYRPQSTWASRARFRGLGARSRGLGAGFRGLGARSRGLGAKLRSFGARFRGLVRKALSFACKAESLAAGALSLGLRIEMGPEQTAVRYASRAVARPQCQVDRMRSSGKNCPRALAR